MIKKLILPAVFLLAISTWLSAATDAADFAVLAAAPPDVYVFNAGYPEVSRLPRVPAGEIADMLGRSASSGFEPWTNQIRIESFAESDFGLVIGVNSSYPLVLDSAGKLISMQREAAETFLKEADGRTTGTLYSDGKSVNFQVYRDSLFNQVGGESEGRRPVIISVEKTPGGDFSVNAPEYPFASENPGWEPVELIHRDGRDLIAWKYSDEKKTRFRYIVHDSDGRAVDEIDESYFRDEYNMTDAEAGPFSVRGFVRAVREGILDDGLSDSGDIFIRLTVAEVGKPSPRYYYSKASGEQPFSGGPRLPVEFSACVDGDICYVIYDNDLFICGADISRYALPELPGDFEYTVLSVSGDRLLVGWEEKRFPFTGRAGMMLIKMRDILN